MAFRWTARGEPRHGRPMLALFALICSLLAGTPGRAASVSDVVADAGHITIRFDASVEAASAFVLDDPRRIAVDVKGAGPGGQVAADGPVSRVRQGRHGEGGARLVFDLASPAIVTQGSFADDGRKLTLDLKPVDTARFAAASGARRLRFFPFALPDEAQAGAARITVPVPPPAPAVPLPAVHGDDTRPLVVIDPGHGGVDPGAISAETGLREKDLTLKIARAIRDELLRDGRVRVALTRDDDRYLVLRERFGIARRLHADLFISIHCDSAADPAATGASAYTLSEVASDKEAARLAARENKADVIHGVDLDDTNADVSSILIDLTQRETMNSSAGFAKLLGREAKPLVPMKAQFHRMASLMVLKAPDMPSILFETGYISNPADAAFLDSKDGEHKIAEAVAQAVEVHFAKRMAAK